MIARISGAALVLCLSAAVACHSGRMTPSAVAVPSGASERVLRVGAHQLYALEWPGSGTPIVMLHGLGGNGASWAGLAHQLAGRHIVALDLPGHGKSPLPADWTFTPMAWDIVAAVRSRWPGAHVWVGHSWGGKLAVAVAAADSAETRGLILVDAVQASPLSIGDPIGTLNRLFAGELDPWPSMDSALRAVRVLPQFTPWTVDVEVAFRRAVVQTPDGRVTPLLSRDKGAAVMRTFVEDLTATAAAVRAPILILSAPSSYFERAQRALFPSADFVSLSGNHWLQISNTEGTASAVRTWLERNNL